MVRTVRRTTIYIYIYHFGYQRQGCASYKSTKRFKFPPKRVKYDTVIHFFSFFLPHPQESFLCSPLLRGNARRSGRIFPEHVEQSFLDPEYSFVAVRQILRTRFVKLKFVQLRTDNVGLRSTYTRTMLAKQMFAQ